MDEAAHAAAVAAELGSIQNIGALLFTSLETHHESGVGSALSPFDVEWWCSKRSDSQLCPAVHGTGSGKVAFKAASALVLSQSGQRPFFRWPSCSSWTCSNCVKNIWSRGQRLCSWPGRGSGGDYC